MAIFTAQDAYDIPKMLAMTEPYGDGCRLWRGSICNTGHPVLHAEGTMVRITRSVYEVRHGPITRHWQIEGACGQPLCIAPEHVRQVRKAMACKPIVGVPLPPGESLKSAGYKLVHRKVGVSVWEPADIAAAVAVVRSGATCEACGKAFANPNKIFCDKECMRVAYRNRAASGRSPDREAAAEAG